MLDPFAGLPDRLRLPLDFDPAPLAADLDAFAEEEWTRHFVRGNYEGSWSVIPLRAAAGETHPARMIGPHPLAEEFVDTPYLARTPALRAALGVLDCPLKSARLMRLRPGSRILEDDDYDPDATGTARLHIPVTTNDGVEFLLNKKRVPMLAGELWYLRLSDPHAVANRGATDRVHLVVDVCLNAWLLGLLGDGGRAAA